LTFDWHYKFDENLIVFIFTYYMLIMKKIKLLLSLLTFVCFFANAQNKVLEFETKLNVSKNNLLDVDFFQTQPLLLKNIIAINDNDIVEMKIDGTPVLVTKILDSKIFADNYLVELNTANGMLKKTLDELNFHGRYFSGVDANSGITNACVNCYNNTLVISYKKNGTEFFIEPLSNFDPSASPYDYIQYQNSDIIPVKTDCHTPANNPTSNSNGPVGVGLSGTNCKVIDYAILCDFTMYTRYNNIINDVINRTVTITNLVQTDYTSAKGLSDDMCFKIVEHYIPTCASCNPWPSNVDIDANLDSFTFSNKITLLNDFDLGSYYFHGSDPNSSTVGLAWLGVVCGNFYHKNALRNFSSNLNSMRTMVSHEVGHNFDASHDPSGSATIMAPTVNGSSTWSALSNTDMNAYISNFTSCLSPCPSVANACDTQGVYGLNFSVNSIASSATLNWLNAVGVSHKVSWYSMANNTWSPVTTVPAGTILNTFTYPFQNCLDTLIVEITPVCANGTEGGSKQIVINFARTIIPSVTIATQGIISATNINFLATPVSAGANPTYQWYVNNVASGTNSPSFSLINPIPGQMVYCIITRTVGCGIGNKDTSNSLMNPTFNLCVNYVPTISISSSQNNICFGTPVTFSAATYSGGVNCPTNNAFQWKVNGNNVGANAATFTTSSLSNGAIVSCTYNPGSTFALPATANSNNITMVILPTVIPSNIITATSNTICPGSTITFTAVASNGGTVPTYQWKKNGLNVGTNSATFITNVFSNNDIITCVYTSNANCATPSFVTSNPITITFSATINPSISITASQNPFCAGTSVSFASSITNGGNLPTYQWFLNGNLVSTLATYGNPNLVAGNTVYCVMTSNATCLANTTATSNTITMANSIPLNPSVQITSSTSSVCPGATVYFSAVPTIGGSAPSYQWKVNGVNVGTNSPAFSSNILPNNAVVTCVLTSNATACLATNVATSNALTISQLVPITPTIAITTTNATACKNSPISFNATITNGGTAPSYQWKKNGANVGPNGPSYTISTLNNGDVISCALISNTTLCVTTNIVYSNPIIVTINNLVNPSIVISTATNPLCQSSNALFTSVVANGGTSPVIQWKINGVNVGINSATFNSTALANNNVITAVVTSNAACLINTNANSNSIVLLVTPSVIPTATITSSAQNICENSPITFNCAGSNLGASPTYQWKVNGINVGVNSPSFTASNLVNGDVVLCNVTSNAVCPLPAVAISNTISVNVITPSVPQIQIGASDASICIQTNVVFTPIGINLGANPVYYWYWNGLLVDSGATYNNVLLENNDSIFCIAKVDLLCSTQPTIKSNIIKMIVEDNLTPNISITSSINAGNAGAPIQYTASTLVTPLYTIQWYRNGAFITNTNGNVWNTTISTPTDSIRAVITNFIGCYTNNIGYSNTIYLGKAESISTWNNDAINLYPNPSSGVAFIDGLQSGDYLFIYDVAGKLIRNFKANNNKMEIDLTMISAGFYQVKIMRKEQIWTSKLIVN
jgi:Metallo-peptidase family M12B Reprolysin-like/Secretion system C-terminal sorting domain